jgi:hypothetical protein
MTARVGARFEVMDPGLVRTRGGVRTACATVLAWATMVAVTSIFGVADPLRITLFGAGTSFLAALLVTDPQRRDRVRTLGWAAVVVAVRWSSPSMCARSRCGLLQHCWSC